MTVLERRPVHRDHLFALIALQVREDQRDLVTANLYTFAEAFCEPGALVWGLWLGEEPVGLMAMIDFRGDPEPFEEVPAGAIYLWRLMIAEGHQGKGHGSAALGFAVQEAKARGYGQIVAGVRDAAHSNLGFYERHGFSATGRVHDGDRMIVLDLADFIP